MALHVCKHLLHAHTCNYNNMIMWGCGGKYLRKCWCCIWPIGCPVVFHVGVVDQTHGDDHGQELLQLSPVVDLLAPAVHTRVGWEGGRVDVLLSIDVSLLNDVVQHLVSDQELEKLKRWLVGHVDRRTSWLLEVWYWGIVIANCIIQAISRDLIGVNLAIKFIITHVILFRKWDVQHGKSHGQCEPSGSHV